MARRKRQLLEDDDDSDSSAGSDVGDFDDTNDPDAREERALFEDPYQRKRRRRNGKEDAVYGVFQDDSEDDGSGGPSKGMSKKRSAFPTFTKGGIGSSVTPQESAPSSPRPSPPPVAKEDSPVSFGASKGKSEKRSAFPTFTKGGIDSSAAPQEPAPSPPIPSPPPVAKEDFPVSFGGIRAQRAFVRDAKSSTPQAAAPLSASDHAQFSKLQGSFGARMLEKMGWQAGTGLGTTGEGIVTPVESKLRPQKMGIAFKGFREKTEQSKAEARRRGEVISDDEEERRPRKGGKKAGQQQEKRSDAWKKPRKIKTRIEHKTYEQIVAEAGQEIPSAGIGQIIDATGAIPREVASLADVSLSSWTPSTDPTRIPEVRHNLRLIAESCRSDLDSLAREAKALEERKRWIVNEDARLRRKVEEEAELIARLQQVHLVVDDINSQSRELASVYEATLEPFQAHFFKLLGQFPNEFDRYRLDEIVVAAIAPLVRRMVAEWRPLEEPSTFISTFRSWRGALKVNTVDETPETQIDIYGARTVSRAPQIEKPMTPFESLLCNVWLPKVRSCINNDWLPQEPQPAVKLYESWSTFLPPFIRDNVLDQLILPKVQKAVTDWNPRKDTVPLQTLVFPWLPYVGLRLEDVMGDARRKLKSLLRAWVVGEGVPQDLGVWKDVFDSGDWDAMLLKHVVPKLGATLRNDFRINPRNQQMEPLHQVLEWADLLRASIFSQLIEAEFFPKWLDVLHVWLIQPQVSFEEVVQWYGFWKGELPEKVQNMPGIKHGFTRGLQLMNKAIELGPDAPTQLPRPDHQQQRAPSPSAGVQRVTSKARPAARTQEITFRSIVEDFAAAHNLLFIPTGRAHEMARMPLFRVSPTADGKGGLLVYILDDAVWAPAGEGEAYRAISLEDMVVRANQ